MTGDRVNPLPRRRVNTSRRFTNEEVYQIRERLKNGETKAALAKEFRVSRPVISDAAHGINTYKDV